MLVQDGSWSGRAEGNLTRQNVLAILRTCVKRIPKRVANDLLTDERCEYVSDEKYKREVRHGSGDAPQKDAPRKLLVEEMRNVVECHTCGQALVEQDPSHPSG